MAEEEKRIREEELRIVKWEEDSSRKVCPLCSTPFSLSVRKHHCRLCGRIVCASPHLSLPPEFGANGDVPPRKVDSSNVEEIKCSSLVIADSKGGAIIKDMPRWDDANGMLEGSKRGIRMCRECRETIM
jgi:rabenosyn-5